MAAAALLEPHGYPPVILDLESADQIDHTLFVFEHHGKYGAVGKSRDVGLDGRKPVFSTIPALVQSYVIPYIDERACLEAYGLLDLRALNGRWRSARHNVWFVEEALRNIPHTPLRLSGRVISHWRNRMRAFNRSHHPDTQPSYFPDQHTWL